MSLPLVSVIVPVYNAADDLAQTLASILGQTHSCLEVIVVNDGSTDGSEAIVKRFNDQRIKYFYQLNQGQAAASNFGLQMASGDYIKFIDADDVINSCHLEMQLKALAGSQTKIASCNWGRFYNQQPSTANFNEVFIRETLSPVNWLKAMLARPDDMMAAWLWLIPRQIVAATGGWNRQLSLNNDFEFSIRLLLQAEAVVYADEAKLYYRSGGAASLSKKISEEAFEAAFLSTKLGCSYLLRADASPEMKRICANRYQLWLHRIYPKHTQLIESMEREVALLGGSDLPLDCGTLLKTVEHLFGWKVAKRLKYNVYRWLHKTDDLACLPA